MEKLIATKLFDRNYLGINKEQALLLCITITLAVMAVELIYSEITNSLMLFSDGLHMLSHAASLGISWLGIAMAKRWKNGRSELWAALINGIGLLVFTLYIFYESFERLADPSSIIVYHTLLVAILGLLVNLTTAWILGTTGIEDLNTKSAFLHMLADTFSSVAIIVGAIIIAYTDWFIIDTLLSVVVAIVVGKWAWGLIRSAVRELR